jgi:hypothetical protein
VGYKNALPSVGKVFSTLGASTRENFRGSFAGQKPVPPFSHSLRGLVAGLVEGLPVAVSVNYLEVTVVHVRKIRHKLRTDGDEDRLLR